MLRQVKRSLVGSPIPSEHAHHQRLSKRRALAVFSSDALSSVAYATEEILLVLMLAGSGALGLSIPISIAITTLLLIVVISYRQTIYEYPSGGGAYIVAKENLGEHAGLTAAAALLIDYVLTVAVSVSAGIEAITSAFPALIPYRETLCLISIMIVTVVNLRGVRESSAVFAIPTYAFIAGIFALLGVGLYKLSNGTFTHVDPQSMTLAVQRPLGLFLLLGAFSQGCTAMTGVEAVSNGVPAFRTPESKNASITLVVMATILGVMFLGITFLSHYHGIVPKPDETVLSQLARSIFDTSPAYFFVQFTTMGILILAANTSYADFPRLSSLLARDRYLPRQLASLGDRLVFSNGIVMLGLMASLLIVIFKASTNALIPLYAVGVFLSFTLSQFGMVRHWLNTKECPWIRVAINAIGGTVTAIVTVIFVLTRFTHGAWVITVLIPITIWIFLVVKEHYISVGRQLTLMGADPVQYVGTPLNHTVLVPISGIHKGVIASLKYAQSIGSDVRAVYVEIDREATQRFEEEWRKWGRGVPLVVLKSPYRSIMRPFLKYVDEVGLLQNEHMITVIIPEFVTAKWWQQLLHNQTAFLIRAAMAFKRGLVVTSIRYHLD